MESPQPPRPGQTLDGTCPVCAAQKIRALPFRYTFQGRYLYGAECGSCRLSFVHPQPTEEEIRAMYSEEYFTECGECGGAHGREAYMETAAQSGEERRVRAAELTRLFRKLAPEAKDYVEVGCGPGFFLSEMRSAGWAVQGIELSRYAAEHARTELRLKVQEASLSDAKIPSASVDVVFLGDVLEHLPDPLQSLDTVRAWLRPGGIVAIAVPSTLNLLSARAGLRWYGLRGRWKTLRIPPYHLFEYTPRTLRSTVVRAGFEPVSLRQSAVPLHRMGLRGSALENFAKQLLQITALVTSRLFNRWGDRLLLVARVATAPPHSSDFVVASRNQSANT